ncbi:MAG: MFS transporter, partial [Pseudomonadota bacterium]
GAALVAQLMIGVLEPASYVSYNILAILCCASVLPLMLTKTRAPTAEKAPRLRPWKVLKLSPLAAAGVIVAGVTTPAFRMVGPIYGQEVGLRADQIGLFLAAAVLGGALAQVPAGWLADRFDRRHVLIGVSVAAAVVSTGITLLGPGSQTLIFAASFLFGLVSLPVFSISAAHANDFATPEQAVEVSAGLMFLYGLGAIAAPLLGSALIAHFGPGSLFAMITAAHLALIAFGVIRMRVRATSATRTRYSYVPRTSFLVGRLLGRRR